MPSLWADSLDDHRQLVLERILRAYGELHAEHGIDGVTLSAVAQRAGLARSAIYNYVADKHDLALTHAEQTVAMALAELTAAVEAADGPAAAVEAYVREAIRGHARWTGAGDELMGLLDDAERARLLAALGGMQTLLGDVVHAGVEAGVLRGPAPATTAFIWAAAGGYRMPVSAGRLDPDEAADTACRLLLDGIRLC